MLFNKNEVRKANEKKVLHKSGKNWIVLSSALLLALAGGAAVSSQTSANADNTNQSNVQQNEQDFLNNVDNNSSINTNNNTTIHSLVGNDLVNAPASSASSKASSASAKSSASSQWYWKWNGGSAQSYYANASSDANVASNESKIVNSYVKSVNAQFPSQTSSLNASLGNAKSVLNNDKSLAASYSAIANNSNYSSEINSLAASAGMTSSAYVQSVEYMAKSYGTAVSYSSLLNSEMTSVNSYADVLNSVANANTAEKAEYSNAAASADTSANEASNVYSNAIANLNAYNSNVANSKGLDLAEQTALNDSVEDKATVQSIADAKGVSFSQVSSEVRSMAVNNDIYRWTTVDGGFNAFSGATTTLAGSSAVASFVADHFMPNVRHVAGTTDTDTIDFTAIASGATDASHRVVFPAAYGKDPYMADTDPELVRVVSNTAVMYDYATEKAAYGKNAKYAAASSAANSASVAYADAQTTANYYDILNDAAVNPNNALDYIFGTDGVAQHLMDRNTDNGANAGETAYRKLGGFTGTPLDTSDVYYDNNILAGDISTFENALPGSIPASVLSSISDELANLPHATNVPNVISALFDAGTTGADAADSVSPLSMLVPDANTGDNGSETRGEVSNDLKYVGDVLSQMASVEHADGVAHGMGTATAGTYLNYNSSTGTDLLNLSTDGTTNHSMVGHILDVIQGSTNYNNLGGAVDASTYQQVYNELAALKDTAYALSDAAKRDNSGIKQVTSGNSFNHYNTFVQTAEDRVTTPGARRMLDDILAGKGYNSGNISDTTLPAGSIFDLGHGNSSTTIPNVKSDIMNTLNAIKGVLDSMEHTDSAGTMSGLSTPSIGTERTAFHYSSMNNAEQNAFNQIAANTNPFTTGSILYNLNNQIEDDGTSNAAALKSALNDADSSINSVINAVSGDNTGLYGAEGETTPEYSNGYLGDLGHINSVANSAASDYTAESNASVAYAKTTDANIALAPYYAASYAGDIKPDEAKVSAASSAQNNFYVAHAGSSYASAAYKASSASDANINDAALAQAYGINVYNNTPKYIRAIKGVRVHSDTNFGSKADKIMGNIPAGDEMTVEGIGLDAHGALRYNIYYKGANYFVSGNANYVVPTFLAAENNVSIVLNKPAKVYNSVNFNSKTATGKVLNANAQVSGDIVRMDNFNDGFTRVRLSNGNYITANTNYVAKVANNDDQQNNINGQNINHYISNANNDNNNNDAPITWGI